MIPKTIRVTMLVCSLGFCVFLVTGTAAADVNKLIENCANCHGKDGVSTEPDVPTIAGYSAPYISDSLDNYKKKARPCPETKYQGGDKKGQKSDMCSVAKDLGAADIKQISRHFSGKKFVRAQQKFDAALAKKGQQIHERSCEKCHSENGSVAADDSGILAGQWMPYLDVTFKEYSAGKRPMPKKMQPKMEKLEKADYDALVHYYGSLK
jgi:sulfide dehydrogenase cytochrome subunit